MTPLQREALQMCLEYIETDAHERRHVRWKINEALAEQPAQQTCNCRWEGEVQVQECTLHESHLLAIHEWAGRAKAAEAKLAEQPAQKGDALFRQFLAEADKAGITHLKIEQPAPVQEPTKAMIDAAERIDWSDSDVRGNIVNMWQAMLAAAPQPAQQEPVASKLLKQEEEIKSLRNDLRRALDAYTQLTRGPAQQQEPVAWMFQHEETGRTMCVDAQQVEWGFEKGNPRLKKIAPIYTSPPAQRTWVGLTDEEIEKLASKHLDVGDGAYGTHYVFGEINFGRAIEAKLKEKNT